MKLSEIIPPKPEIDEVTIDGLRDKFYNPHASDIAKHVNAVLDAFYSQLLANVEQFKREAVRVYGMGGANWHKEQREVDTHSGILLFVEPIDNRVALSEVIEFLRRVHDRDHSNAMADRLQKFGIKV